MALSVTTGNAIINDIVLDFDRLYMVDDPTNLIALGDSIGSHTSRVLNTYRVPVWDSATNGNQVTVDNDLTTNPLYYGIPAGSDITHYVFTNSSGVVTAIRTLPSPTAFSVDNYYYVRTFTINFTNV